MNENKILTELLVKNLYNNNTCSKHNKNWFIRLITVILFEGSVTNFKLIKKGMY